MGYVETSWLFGWLPRGSRHCLQRVFTVAMATESCHCWGTTLLVSDKGLDQWRGVLLLLWELEGLHLN